MKYRQKYNIVEKDYSRTRYREYDSYTDEKREKVITIINQIPKGLDKLNVAILRDSPDLEEIEHIYISINNYIHVLEEVHFRSHPHCCYAKAVANITDCLENIYDNYQITVENDPDSPATKQLSTIIRKITQTVSHLVHIVFWDQRWYYYKETHKQLEDYLNKFLDLSGRNLKLWGYV